MGFWSWLMGGTPADAPASLPLTTPFGSSDHLERIVFQELWGTAGIMGRPEAMTVPGIARARNALCGIASLLPLTIVQNGVPAREQRWEQSIETGRPRSTTVAWMLDDLIFYGRTDLVVRERAADGSVTRLQRVPVQHRGVDDAGRMVRAWDEPVRLEDTVRVDGIHEGILNASQLKVRELVDLETSLATVAANPVPLVELHHTDDGGTPMTETEVTRLREQWMTARRNPNGMVGYTPPQIELKVHGAPLSDVLVSGDNRSALTAARIMNVPAWIVDASVAGSSLTYANVASRLRELVAICLAPYLTAIEDRLSLDDVLPAGVWARFDRASVVRDEDKDRWEAYKIAKDIGLLTVEDMQARERGVIPETLKGVARAARSNL